MSCFLQSLCAGYLLLLLRKKRLKCSKLGGFVPLLFFVSCDAKPKLCTNWYVDCRCNVCNWLKLVIYLSRSTSFAVLDTNGQNEWHWLPAVAADFQRLLKWFGIKKVSSRNEKNYQIYLYFLKYLFIDMMNLFCGGGG